MRAHHVAHDADKETAVALAAAEEGLNGAKTALRCTKTALEKAKQTLVDGLSKAGLGDEDFASAKTDVDRLEDLEAAIREYDENVAANVDRVRRLEEEIGDREWPDVKAERAKGRRKR